MSVESKTFTFNANGLPRAVDLLLILSPPDETTGSPLPICWRTISLKEGGPNVAQVEHSGYTAFFVPKVDKADIVTTGDPGSSAICLVGSECTVNNSGVISPAVPGKEGYFTCKHESKTPGNVALGFCDIHGDNIEPAFLWEGIEEVVDKFAHGVRLAIYATNEYQKGQVIRNPTTIESSLIAQDLLDELNEKTQYFVSIDDKTGQTIVVRD